MQYQLPFSDVIRRRSKFSGNPSCIERDHEGLRALSFRLLACPDVIGVSARTKPLRVFIVELILCLQASVQLIALDRDAGSYLSLRLHPIMFFSSDRWATPSPDRYDDAEWSVFTNLRTGIFWRYAYLFAFYALRARHSRILR